jgi:competence protein ComEC
MKTLKYLFAVILAVVIIVILAYQFIPSRQSQPAPSTSSVFQVSFLDVGQADSIAIRSGDSSLLIDAGTNNTAKNLVTTLKNLGFTRFDDVVGTHPHEDHIGGMDSVINEFNIGTIYMPKVSANTKTFTDVMQAVKNKGLTVTTPVAGSSFTLGSATCTILAPNSSSYEDLNNFSIVIRLLYGDTSFLFTGDAQIESEKEMLARNYSLQSDVLKVGHHGSSTSTSATFLKAVSPKYAVIEVGQGNDYGHPHQETLDKLKAAGTTVYRTDQNGTITFTSDGSNLTIKTGK